MIIDKFKIQTYNVGFIKRDIHDILEFGIKSDDIAWLNHTYRDRFFADPFLLYDDDKFYYVLCEEFLFFEEKGKITLLIVDKKTVSLVSRRVIIEESTHLSFPYCDYGTDKIYPENSASGNFYRYTLDKSNGNVISKDLVIEKPLIDCVQIRKVNATYFYASTTRNPNGEMILYVLSDVGKLRNERILIKDDKAMARAAGLFFIVDGELYRPAQVCINRYGEETVILKAKFYDDGRLDLKPVIKLNGFKNGKFGQTLHTFNVYKDVIVVDGSHDFVRFPSKFFYKKMKFLFKRRLD